MTERDVAPDDFVTQVRWRTARARILARSGQWDTANATARDAVQLADQTDLIDLRSGVLLDLAEVLRTPGRPNEAVPLARKALRTLERKGARRLIFSRRVPFHPPRYETPRRNPKMLPRPPMA